MGQGGTMAIEDAVFLAALMPLGTQPGEIVSRLPLLQKYRGERINRIQDYSRRNGKDLSDPHNPRPTTIQCKNPGSLWHMQ
ncbi:unnamed protein product [Clonostachys byssicola]|uniref:Uncharacterized protein n=1 Tax=Clonostachys byssicola TaxID=160290 RepID=A0A9N9XYJ8_9HYPO|nr:unnamed protein product [Clonostachys byssicola]